MSAGTAQGLQNAAGPAGQAGRHGDGGQQGGTAPTSTPSGFNFEPANIFDWASSHHAPQHHQAPRGNASPYYQHAAPPPQQQQQTQPPHNLDLVSALGGGNTSMSGQPQQQQQEDDDEDDDDDDEDDDDDPSNQSGRQNKSNGQIANNLGRKRVRGSGPTHRLNRKGGGRPKDFIWAYFEEHHTPMPTAENPKYVRHSAECKACGWTCEQPKAFRMRQHVVLNCENLPDAEKQRVQAIQQQKDAATEQKKHSKRSNSNNDVLGNDSVLGPTAPAPASAVDSHLNGSFGDMFGRLSNTHPGAGGSGDPSFFSYSTLAGGGGGAPDVSSSLAGPSANLAGPGTVPTGTSLDKQGNYKTSSSSGSKKRRKKEDSASAAAVGSNWNLSSFLGVSSPSKMGKSPITCHVLDSSAGRPGSSIKIRMDQLGQTGFMHVATGETDTDGRNNSLLPSTLKIDKNAIYKMTFYTREYFNSKGIESFYPFVEVVFEVKDPDEHHHIALLLSPFSYTTYRGS